MKLSNIFTLIILLSPIPSVAADANHPCGGTDVENRICSDNPADGYIKIVKDDIYFFHYAGLLSSDSYSRDDGFRLQYCEPNKACEDIKFQAKADVSKKTYNEIFCKPKPIEGITCNPNSDWSYGKVVKSSSKIPTSYMKNLSIDFKPFWQSEDSSFMPVYQAFKNKKDIRVKDLKQWKKKTIDFVNDHFAVSKTASDEWVILVHDKLPAKTETPRQSIPAMDGEQQQAPEQNHTAGSAS